MKITSSKMSVGSVSRVSVGITAKGRCLTKLKNSVGIVRWDFSISVQALVIGSPVLIN